MHSPRIRLPTKANRQLLFRSWNGERPQFASISKALSDDLQRFTILVATYSEENGRLRDTLAALHSVGSGPQPASYLLGQIEQDLTLLSSRIDARAAALRSVGHLVTRSKEVLLGAADGRVGKPQLLLENGRLVQRALFLERQMIAAKLQLRLHRDHSGLCRLKRRRAILSGDAAESVEDDESEVQRNKERARNLKRAIKHEKMRLARLTVGPTARELAAELIQRYWRGFATRRNLRPKRPPPDAESRDGSDLAGVATPRSAA
jgi:hypothetical protein